MNPEGASLETQGRLLCSSLGKIPSLGHLSLFLRFLTDWMRPTNIMEYKLIYSKATIEMLLLLFSHSISPLFANAWTPAHQASLSFTISQSFLKLMSFESVIPSNNLDLCHPISYYLQSFPASGSFPVSSFFASGGQNIGDSVSASVLPMNIQNWFPLKSGLNGLTSLLSKGLSRVFNTSLKASILWCSAFFTVQLAHQYMTTGKTIALIIWIFVSKVISLLLICSQSWSQLFFQGESIF